jgi:hypothetical protein
LAENEEAMDQMIREDQHIKTWEMCEIEGKGFNILKTILGILGYTKLCARWVPRIVKQRMQA